MILYVKGADFSSANIGTLNTFTVIKNIGAGATFTIPDTVKKNSSVNWTITLDEGYTFGNVSIMMGYTKVEPTINENVMSIVIGNVTSNLTITVATINESTGEEDDALPGVKNYALPYTQWNWKSGLNGQTIQEHSFSIEVELGTAIVLGHKYQLSETPFNVGDTIYWGIKNFQKTGGNISICFFDSSGAEIQPRCNGSVKQPITILSPIVPSGTVRFELRIHGSAVESVYGEECYLATEPFDENTIWK